MFVVPKQDYTDPAIWPLYADNYIMFVFATDSFSVEEFLNRNIEYPFQPTYDTYIRTLNMKENTTDFKSVM